MEKALGLYEDVKSDMKFFVSSDVRSKILISLMQKPKNLPILRQEIDFSSSTILHAMYQLENKKFVFKESGNYSLTQMGELAALKLVNLMKSFSSMNKLQNILLNHEIEVIPHQLLQGIECLEKGQILESKPNNLIQPYQTISDKVLNSKNVKIISSVFYPFFVDVLKNSCRNDGILQILMTQEVGNIILSDFRSEISIMGKPNIHLWKTDNELKLCLVLADDFMAMGLFLDNGVYDSNRFLISNSEESIIWANELFKYYLDKAIQFKL